MIRHLSKLTLAVLLLAALTGAEQSCERVDTNRPPSEHQVDPAEKRTVQIRASSANPYTLMIIATDGKGKLDRYGPRHVAAGTTTDTLDYETGARLEIKVSVRGHPDDILYCAITDGTNVDRKSGKGEIVCLLTTSR